jgi:hypothetical protein
MIWIEYADWEICATWVWRALNERDSSQREEFHQAEVGQESLVFGGPITLGCLSCEFCSSQAVIFLFHGRSGSQQLNAGELANSAWKFALS